MLKLKRIADQLANDVLERSDDQILLDQAQDLREYIKSMPIKREDAIEEASEYFDFEGMRYNNYGDELDTLTDVEERAIKFLEDKGYEIIN